jgi:hypothetical protein
MQRRWRKGGERIGSIKGEKWFGKKYGGKLGRIWIYETDKEKENWETLGKDPEGMIFARLLITNANRRDRAF